MPELERVTCANPDPSKEPTRILKWKYDLIRGAILEVLSASPVGVPFKSLSGLVKKSLADEELKKLGSIAWYTVVVKLDLEARGALERVPGIRPQVVRQV